MKKSKIKKELKGLTIQFVPFSEIKDLDSNGRIKKILNLVLGNNIVVLQGKLKAEEEARLIGDTMAMIDYVKNFKGIELAVLGNGTEERVWEKFRRGVANVLFGDLQSITVIGPATIVKEIKRNPKKIELFLNK